MGIDPPFKKNWNIEPVKYLLLYGQTDNSEIEQVRKQKRRHSNFYLRAIKRAIKLHSFNPKLEEQTILEFGSGEGLMVDLLAPLFKRYYCLDISSLFLDMCMDRNKSHKNVEYRVVSDYNFSKITIPDDSIDVIISSAVFCHCNFYEFIIYFKKFYELLSTNGIVILDFIDSDAVTWSDEKIHEMTEHYKRSPNGFDMLFNPISGDMVKRELSKMGFVEWHDSRWEEINRNTKWNSSRHIGFRKV